MYKTILIPTDGSNCSEQALKEGLALAHTLSAKVLLLHAVEDPIRTVYASPELINYQPELYRAVKHTGEQILQRAESLAQDKAVEYSTKLIEHSSPADAILNSEADADLIVIGTHGRQGFNRFVFGSVAEAVMRRATTPCLIVRSEG